MTKVLKPGFGITALTALVWALSGPTAAYAGHGSHGSSGGSYGSHGSSGGYYGSHGSSGGYYGSHGSSGGYYGSHGSSGGYYGSHGSSGGQYGSHGSSGGYHNGGGHHNNGHEEQAYRRTRDQRVARVVIKVPRDAKVYLQDQPMTLSGTTRQFVSPRLNPEKEYEYTIRVEVQKDGELLSETTKARVRAGKRVEVSVDLSRENPNQLVASVK